VLAVSDSGRGRGEGIGIGLFSGTGVPDFLGGVVFSI
jgi:hypothetical protein